MYLCRRFSNIRNMKKSILAAVAILFVAVLFSSCGKECICTTSYVTATKNDVMTSEMGKMSEDDCLSYNRTFTESEGVVRIIDCKLDK